MKRNDHNAFLNRRSPSWGERWFIRTAIVSIAFTGIAKLFSAIGADGGAQAVFGYREPVFGFNYRWLFLVVGSGELFLAAYCLLPINNWRKIWVIATFATLLAIYRFSLWVLDYHMPCSCLGTLTDHLHIEPGVADAFIMGLLGYLWTGSCGLLASSFLRSHDLKQRSTAG